MKFLRPAEFVAFAPEEVGKLARINHTDCSAGVDRKRRLYIKRTDENIVAYCHNCGCKGVYTTTTSSPRKLSVLKNILNKEEHTIHVAEIRLPNDYTTNLTLFSTPALEWLRKYIGGVDIRQNYIGYSASMDRVILPVFNDEGELIFWQGRSLSEEHTPKYYNVKSVDKPYMLLHAEHFGNSCVVVEDILSAIKLFSNGYNAVALLGTSLSTALAVTLKDRYDCVIVWLDDDRGGHMGSMAVTTTLKPFIHKLHVIRNKQQPKEVTDFNPILGDYYD